jgi:hypothetical protein
MAEPRRTLSERTLLLEAGQEQIITSLDEIRKELKFIRGRVDFLNGHAPKLYELAKAAPDLIDVAKSARELVTLAQERADQDAARRVEDTARVARKRKFWWFASDDLRVGYILASVMGGGTLLVLPHVVEWIQHLWK